MAFDSEGEYAGSGSWLFKGKPNEVVIQNGVFSRTGCERVIRYAFELAKKEGKTLTSIIKANATTKEVGDEIIRLLREDSDK